MSLIDCDDEERIDREAVVDYSGRVTQNRARRSSLEAVRQKGNVMRGRILQPILQPPMEGALPTKELICKFLKV